MRFDLKTELKVIKALSKILSEKDDNLKAETEGNINTISDDNVCMVIAKTEQAKHSILRFTTKKILKEPKLDYTTESRAIVGVNTQYLKKIANLFDILDESVKIYAKSDYPITFENEHFKVILAPRVDMD